MADVPFSSVKVNFDREDIFINLIDIFFFNNQNDWIPANCCLLQYDWQCLFPIT
jgi:hypothetical protein